MPEHNEDRDVPNDGEMYPLAQVQLQDIVIPRERRGLPDFGELTQEEQRDLENRFEQIGEASEALSEGVEEDPDEALFRDFDDDAVAADGQALMVAGEDGQDPARRPVYQGPNIGGAIRVALPEAAPAEQDRQAVVHAGGQRGNVAAVVNPAWRPLYELPGYMGAGANPAARDRMGEAIRTLGRTIFRSMPCFRRMEEECRAARRDPLGEVQVMANIAGRGPNNAMEMDAMANWIRANGMMVDGGQIEFPNVMRGYRPNIILAASEDDSFLMVEERRNNGAPIDATYIYSWRGGRQTYLENPDARTALQRIGGVHAERVQDAPAALPPGAPQQPAAAAVRPAAVAQPQPQRIPVGQVRAPAPVPDPAPARGRGRRNQAPQGRDVRHVDADLVRDLAPVAQAAPKAPPRASAMQIFRQAGYATVGTNDGPALRRDLGDGRTAQVMGADGKSLTLAKAFTVKLIETDGERLIAEGTAGSVEDTLAWIDAQSAHGLRR